MLCGKPEVIVHVESTLGGPHVGKIRACPILWHYAVPRCSRTSPLKGMKGRVSSTVPSIPSSCMGQRDRISTVPAYVSAHCASPRVST